jgi:hypothetical protein
MVRDLSPTAAWPKDEVVIEEVKVKSRSAC